MPSSTTTTRTCESCSAINKNGSPCSNRTCKESNNRFNKPLCATHTKAIDEVMSEFNKLSPANRLVVMRPMTKYLDRRNIEFVIAILNDPSVICPNRRSNLEIWKTTILDKFNSMSTRQKRKHVAEFTTYMCMKGAEYEFQVKNL
jgi:hypothetical protein